MNKQKEFDKGQWELAIEMSDFWRNKVEYYTGAVKNGRCNECNKPLKFNERVICEDCSCPE